MGLLRAKARKDLVVSQVMAAMAVMAEVYQAERPEDSQCLLGYRATRAELRR